DKPTHLALLQNGDWKALLPRLLKQYDTNADGHLSPSELGLGAETAAMTEADWSRIPTIPGTIQLNETTATSQATFSPAATTGWVRSEGPLTNRADVRRAGQRLELAVTAPFATAERFQIASSMDYRYPTGRYEVKLKELDDSEFTFTQAIFPHADTNADGTLTKDEYTAYITMQQSLMDLPVAALYAVRTPTLFAGLDEDNDGRLSQRELLQGHERLRALFPGTEPITLKTFRVQGAIRILPNVYLMGNLATDNAAFLPTRSTRPRGPIWFTRMDQNNDGDLTPSEFLGTTADFQQIDTNKDRFITVTEAITYDARVRGKK
ncbi:MAG: hypothetical protein ACRCZF_25675, partial [Gemmataceae bacterium]